MSGLTVINNEGEVRSYIRPGWILIMYSQTNDQTCINGYGPIWMWH